MFHHFIFDANLSIHFASAGDIFTIVYTFQNTSSQLIIAFTSDDDEGGFTHQGKSHGEG